MKKPSEIKPPLKNKFLMADADPISMIKLGEVQLNFKFEKYTRVTKARLAYTGLELVAEFGGYVGLFLGISVFNLSQVFDTFLSFIYPN